MLEPLRTAILLTAIGALAAISAVFSRGAGRVGIPLNLTFLALGMAAGVEGLGVGFTNFQLAFGLGYAALALILFDGGLNTPMSALRPGIWPAGVLATVGVAGTAILVAAGAHFFGGFDWMHAMLIGAIVSSTDAAAVFSVLRGSRLQLQRRVGITLELESGLNDPMAVILTISLTEALVRHETLSWTVLPLVVVQLAIGAIGGVVAGKLGEAVLKRAHLPATGLYPVLTMGIAFLAFGVTSLLQGSGFLAVYLAAVILGNAHLPYKSGLLRVHDALAWLSQILMFVVLGLLIVPSALLDDWHIGLGLAVLLAFFARPVVVAACLLPFRYPLREIGYIGWVGLRGAVPIVLATFPVLSGADGAQRIFNVVFFIVVVSAIAPGGTVRWITRRLGLESDEPPAPEAVIEISSTMLLKGEVMSFFVEPASAVSGSSIAQLPFPESTVVMLVVRGKDLIAPRGPTVLQPGDHVYLFCAPEDRPLVQLIFGRMEQG